MEYYSGISVLERDESYMDQELYEVSKAQKDRFCMIQVQEILSMDKVIQGSKEDRVLQVLGEGGTGSRHLTVEVSVRDEERELVAQECLCV